ncbi:helix-turn-helix domain-containing protein [Streptomyces sp. BBFR2]|uniref:helix-turn-helix domain-containing protein n=1 Tax=Streptomyces sp. BBFR2 TaxID=3372854 RepID=UPI0037D9AA23
MAKPKRLDPSASPRAMLGAELRHQREKAGLSQDELGLKLFVSGSFIGQLEAGIRRLLPEYAQKIDEIFKTDGYFTRNCEAAARSKYPDHFAEVAELETQATSIKQYSPSLIPGLLQSEGYARAVFRGGHPTAPDSIIDELVVNRIERAWLLDNPTTPMLWAVLDEAVLRRKVGGPGAMAEALRHIAALARRRRIIVQVLPFSVGAHTAIEGSLKLMAFTDAPPLAYVDGMGSGQLLDDPATVSQYGLSYDLLAASALSPEASLALIEEAAEAFTDEDQQE